MMDPITAISTVGFPIVMCLLYYLDMKKIINKNTEAFHDIKEVVKRCNK